MFAPVAVLVICLVPGLQGNVQQEVLQHVVQQGKGALDAFLARHPAGPPGLSLKVVSDIDDTLMCSGGHFPAGRDVRYPAHTVYPGMLTLLKELGTGHVLRCQVHLPSCLPFCDIQLTSVVQFQLLPIDSILVSY